MITNFLSHSFIIRRIENSACIFLAYLILFRIPCIPFFDLNLFSSIDMKKIIMQLNEMPGKLVAFNVSMTLLVSSLLMSFIKNTYFYNTPLFKRKNISITYINSFDCFLDRLDYSNHFLYAKKTIGLME